MYYNRISTYTCTYKNISSNNQRQIVTEKTSILKHSNNKQNTYYSLQVIHNKCGIHKYNRVFFIKKHQ